MFHDSQKNLYYIYALKVFFKKICGHNLNEYV